MERFSDYLTKINFLCWVWNKIRIMYILPVLKASCPVPLSEQPVLPHKCEKPLVSYTTCPWTLRACLWVVKAIDFIPHTLYLHFHFCSDLNISQFLFDSGYELFSVSEIFQTPELAVCLHLLLKIPNIRICYCLSHLLILISHCIT